MNKFSLTSGLVITFAPPANAAEQSPAASARQAFAIATVDDEHAVSITTDGPLHPNAYEIFPLKKARNVPCVCDRSAIDSFRFVEG